MKGNWIHFDLCNLSYVINLQIVYTESSYLTTYTKYNLANTIIWVKATVHLIYAIINWNTVPCISMGNTIEHIRISGII